MTINEAIRSNTVPSDFEAFKKFFEVMGIKYEIPADNLIYLSGFEVNSSQLIVIKFYEDGRFQEFCPYPEEGLTELKDLREVNKMLISECDRLIKEKGELLKKSEQTAEYKRFLKLAVEDMGVTVAEVYNGGLICECCKWKSQIGECCCPDDGGCDVAYRWRYADEVKKLMGGETDD